MRICVDCKHHRARGYHFALHYCSAVTFPPKVDPVTGLKRYVDGQGVLRSNPHPLCDEVNRDGECALYQGKREK